MQSKFREFRGFKIDAHNGGLEAQTRALEDPLTRGRRFASLFDEEQDLDPDPLK